MSRTINYGTLMHRAMRGLIREVLEDVQAHGLPGDHHFFITFETGHPDVRIADWLAQRYPEDMTVVMQHWFEDLHVDEAGFGVTLNFGETRESLYIPYTAIVTFVDPSVEFGLRFEATEDDEDALDDGEDGEIAEITPPVRDSAKGRNGADQGEDSPAGGAGEVVSLDSFRK